MSGRSEDNPKATIGRLADVMSHGYNIDTLVPILEAYQGSRALEGNLPAAEILSDIHGYLAAKATRSTPEDVKPRDIEPAMGQSLSVFIGGMLGFGQHLNFRFQVLAPRWNVAPRNCGPLTEKPSLQPRHEMAFRI